MLQIPAVEWDLLERSGTITDESNIITVTDAAGIALGMSVYTNDLPFNSIVTGISGLNITISKDATATGARNFSFYKRFDFTYPAKEDQGEQNQAKRSVSNSLSGIQQVVINHIEAKRNLTFDFITLSDKLKLQDDFYNAWAVFGKSFRFFNDKEINAPIIYEDDAGEVNQKRTVKKHPDYLYELSFNFRRIL